MKEFFKTEVKGIDMIEIVKRIFLHIFIFIQAQIILLFHYDRKYIRGKFFESKYHNMIAPGWRWIVDDYYGCKKLHKNLSVPFPCSPLIKFTNPNNIEFDPDDLVIFQTQGSYYQAYGRITIGKGSYIAPNVGLITANHNIVNLDEHDDPKEIVIGKQCWIGMNSVILPGVRLGDRTIVGAGSVVTKSFPNGNCVVVGNPARMLRENKEI